MKRASVRNRRTARRVTKSHVALADHNLAEMRRMYDALLEKYHTLAIQLATAAHLGVRAPREHTEAGKSAEHHPAPPQSANGTVAKPPHVVAEAIRAEANGEPRLAQHFRKLALQMKREGKKPEEIALAVGTWQSTEDEGRE